MSEEQDLEDIRAELESRIIDTFHQKDVLFQEGPISKTGFASITTSDWGVNVELIFPDLDEPLVVSGRWDVLGFSGNRLFALYVNWSIQI
jgi:hypothetical protein